MAKLALINYLTKLVIRGDKTLEEIDDENRELVKAKVEESNTAEETE